jgi:hypothetical protein
MKRPRWLNRFRRQAMPEGSPIARLIGETDRASIYNAMLRLSYQDALHLPAHR